MNRKLKILFVIAAVGCIAIASYILSRSAESNDNSVWQSRQYEASNVDYRRACVGKELIPTSKSMAEDIPAFIYFDLYTYYLSSPHFPKDRMILCRQTEMFWLFVPCVIDKCIFRLPRDFPEPDEKGNVGDIPYIAYVFNFMNDMRANPAKYGYTRFDNQQVSMISDKTKHEMGYEYNMMYDLTGDPATEFGKEAYFDVAGKFRHIDDVGFYLYQKYDIANHPELLVDEKYVLLYNNKYDYTYTVDGSTYKVYIHMPGHLSPAADKFLKKIGVKVNGISDGGLYLEYSSRYDSTDEFHIFSEICDIAMNVQKQKGRVYDDLYSYDSKFRYDRVRFKDGKREIVHNDIIRFIDRANGYAGKFRKDFMKKKRRVYIDNSYRGKFSRDGYEYAFAVGMNPDKYAEDDDKFDFGFFVWRPYEYRDGKPVARTIDGRAVFGTLLRKDFPKWDCMSDPPEDFVEKLYSIYANVCIGKNVDGVHVIDDMLGKFSIFNQHGELANILHCNRMYGRKDYGYAVWPQAAQDEWEIYTKVRGRLIEVEDSFKCEFQVNVQQFAGMKFLASGDYIKVAALRPKTYDKYQWVFFSKVDHLTGNVYDRILIRVRNPKYEFFKDKFNVIADVEKLCELAYKHRDFNYEDPVYKSQYGMYEGSVKINESDVIVDLDFTGTEQFNTISDKSYRFLMTDK